MLSLLAIHWIDQIETCNADPTLTEPQRELMLIGMFYKFGEIMGGPVVNCMGDTLRVVIHNPIVPLVDEGDDVARYSNDPDEEVDDDITPSIDD